MKDTTTLTTRYSFLQSFFWAAFCPSYVLLSLYLAESGFFVREIGIILAIANIFVVLLQPLLADFADRTTRMTLKHISVLLVSLTIFVILLLYLAFDTFLLIAICVIFISITSMTISTLINAIGMYYINKGFALNFGIARGLGSISFAFVSLILGVLIERFGADIILIVSAVLYALLLLTLSTFKMERNTNMSTAQISQREHGGLIPFFKKYKRFCIMLIGVIFIFSFHAILGTYLLQIVRYAGGSQIDVGLCLGIAAACEMPVMFFFTYLSNKFPSGTLLKISAVFFAVKAIVFLFIGNIWVVRMAQFLQIPSYALYTPASVFYANRLVSSDDKVKGQSFLVVAQVLGSIIGTLIGGLIHDSHGVMPMIQFGVILSVIGGGIVFFCSPNINAANEYKLS